MSPNVSAAALPWYREPWPWILIAGPAIVVVAGFITLYIAITLSDPLVVDNYYKEGLAINRTLDRDHVASQRGYRAVVATNSDRTVLRIQTIGAGLPPVLRLRLIHPTKSGFDQTLVATQVAPDVYQANLQLTPALRWDVELDDAQQQWRLTGSWYVSDDTFALEPRHP
jgi:uncharacterized protein